MEIVESIQRITAPGAPMMQPAKFYKSQMDGKASAFLIKIRPKAVAYRYDVSIRLKWFDQAAGRDFDKDLAKGRDEGLRSRNRGLCYELLAAASQIKGFLNDVEIVYDCKSTIYSTKPLDKKFIDKEISFLTVDTRNQYILMYAATDSTAHVTIRENAKGHVLELDDFLQYETRQTIHQENRSIRTFLEMAVAQYSLNNLAYTPIGVGKMFELNPNQQMRAIGNGMVLRSGISKGVRIVQGLNPCLVVDAKVSPFFEPQELLQTVTAMGNNRIPQTSAEWIAISNLLEDLRVEVNNVRSRTFGIKKLSEKRTNEIMVRYNGQMMSLNDYWGERYSYELSQPDLPAVIPHYDTEPDSPDGYFPIECLTIMPDQRVPLEKMSAQLSLTLLAENSLLPEARYNRVIEHLDNMHVFAAPEDNPVLHAFGISVDRDSNDCKINVRHAPRIEFRGAPPLVVNEVRADWRTDGRSKYYTVDRIYNWVILCFKQHAADVRAFSDRFMDAAARRGMEIAERPNIEIFCSTEQMSKWTEIFNRFSQQNVQFVILVDPKKMDTHGILKYFEVRKKILTQHITHERVRDVITNSPKGRQTLENILNKTNQKYSGVNYHLVLEESLGRFKLEGNDVLVIGYDVAQPPPMSSADRRMCQTVKKEMLSFDPSVIGITANMATDPHNFVGDYYFQEALREGLNYDLLADKFRWVLDMRRSFRPDAGRPKYVFVIRNGLSEGQFAQSVQREIDALTKGCGLHDPQYRPKFVYVLGTKRHFKKYYALTPDQRIANMKPGSVIDHKFVREDCPEFFMQSHFALKGVGKPVEYNVLLDEIGMTKDEVEGFLNSLCYSHQIVNSAVSMPEPVYQADELAKRGRNNYITMKRLEPTEIPREQPHNFVDVNLLNDILTYRDNPIFVSTRYTA